MNNQMRGGKRQEGFIDAMEDGTIAAICSRMAEKALESSSNDSTQNPACAGGKKQTVVLPGLYTYLLDSESGFVQTLDLPQTMVYIRSSPSDRQCGH